MANNGSMSLKTGTKTDNEIFQESMDYKKRIKEEFSAALNDVQPTENKEQLTDFKESVVSDLGSLEITFQDSWTEFPSLRSILERVGVLEVVMEGMDFIIKQLVDAMTLLETFMAFIEKMKKMIMNFINIWLATLTIILNTIKELMAKVKKLLYFFDLTGNGVYMTQFTVPWSNPWTNDGKVVEYDKIRPTLNDMMTTWPGRPNVEDSICGVLFFPYTAFRLSSFGDIVGAAKDLVGGISDLANSIADIFKKDIQQSQTEFITNSKVSGENRKNITLLYQRGMYVFMGGFEESMNARKARLKGILGEIDSKISEVVEADAASLEAQYKMSKEVSNAVCKQQSNVMMSADTPLMKASTLGKAIVSRHSSQDFIEFRFGSRDNNYFIIKEIKVVLKDNTTGQIVKVEEGEVNTLYSNPRLKPFYFSEDLISLQVMDKEIQGICPTDTLHDPADFMGRDMYNSTQYSAPTLNTEEEVDASDIEQKILYIKNKTSQQILGIDDNIWEGEHISLQEEPSLSKSFDYFDYGTRASLSKRSELTPSRLYMAFRSMPSPIATKLQETISPEGGGDPTPKYSAYFHITTVSGDAMLAHEDMLKDSVTMETTLENLVWDQGSITHTDSLTSALLLPPIKDSEDENSWISAATPEMTLDEVMKQILPKAVRKGINDAVVVIDDVIEELEDAIKKMGEMGRKLSSILADIQKLIALVQNQIIRKLIDAVIALLNQPVPGIYLALWRGGSDELPGIIEGALMKQDIYRETKGGAVFFMDSSTIVFILELLKLYDSFRDFFESEFIAEKAAIDIASEAAPSFDILIPKEQVDIPGLTGINAKFRARMGIEELIDIPDYKSSVQAPEMVAVQVQEALSFMAKGRANKVEVDSHISKFSTPSGFSL